MQLLAVPACPGAVVAGERLRLALSRAGRADVVVERLEVRTPQQADELGFTGSPTVLVDGVDPFAGPDDVPALACRLYRTADGVQQAPTLAALVSALATPPPAG